MGRILEKLPHRVNDVEDFVHLRLGVLSPRFDYRNGFRMAQGLRMAAKMAAQRLDRITAQFWRAIDLPDLDDCPPTSPWPQRSAQVQNFGMWTTGVTAENLVFLLFDDQLSEMDYEKAIKLHHDIRRAARRAKAWAGDRGMSLQMAAHVTSAEENYRLGV